MSPVLLDLVCQRRTAAVQLNRLVHLSARRSSKQSKSTAFPLLNGSVDRHSDTYKRNVEGYKKYIEQYQQILKLSCAGGGEKAIARHTQQHKKLLAMDRVKLLLDDDADFLELSANAGIGMPYGDIPRAGVVSGIGKIHGRPCMVTSSDGTVKGGTIFPITLQKQLRAQEIAQQNRIPSVYIVDSGGAFLPLQAEIFNPGGRTFYNEAVLSAMGVPQLAVVCGMCTAGGAYVPTMADEAVIIHRIGTIYLGGPPLVKAATGEVVSAEELGGATLHSSVSGCTDYFGPTEAEGFNMARDAVAAFNQPDYSAPSRPPTEPEFDAEELLGMIPLQNQHEMDIHKVIARLVDGSRFNEFKVKYGTGLVTGFAHIKGYLVGILGNSGVLTDTAAAKGAHFIQMCSERHIPLIFLQNTAPDDPNNTFGVTGGNFLRDHAKMMAAVSCAAVPKITVVIGNSIGPTNYLMGGRSTSPNFMFSWPNAVIGMMEKNQMILNICQEKFGSSDVSDEEKSSFEEKLQKKFSAEMSGFFTSSNLVDDGTVLPQDTRRVLGQCLEITSTYLPRAATSYPVIRM